MSELLPEILVSAGGQQLGADATQVNSLEKIPINQEFAKLFNNSLEHHQVPSGETGQLVSKLMQGKDLPFNGKFLPSGLFPAQLNQGAVVASGISAGAVSGLSAETPTAETPPIVAVALPVQTDLPEIQLPGLSLDSENIELLPNHVSDKKTGIEQALQQLDSKGNVPIEVLQRLESSINQVNQPRTPLASIMADPVTVTNVSTNAPSQNPAAQVLVRAALGSQASDVARDRIAEGKVPALTNSDTTALHNKAIPQAATTRIVPTENLETRFLNNEIIQANSSGNSENVIPVAERSNGQFNSQLTARLDAMQALPVSTTAPSGTEKVAVESLARTSPELQMQYSLSKPEWAKEFSTKIAMMTRQEMPSAVIRMNPAHLGPVEVRISMQNDMANVSFVAHNPAVREAIESAMPKLREMLDNNGLGLADVDVSEHSHAGNQERAWEQAKNNSEIMPENLIDHAYDDDLVLDVGPIKTYEVNGSVDIFV